MPLEYCSFISYPHGQDNVMRPFVEDFEKGLSIEINSQNEAPRSKLRGIARVRESSE